jgi:hypothetical protein
MAMCKAIAPRYGICAKTVRDIWKGRTWFLATKHLWTAEEVSARKVHEAPTLHLSSAEAAVYPNENKLSISGSLLTSTLRPAFKSEDISSFKKVGSPPTFSDSDKAQISLKKQLVNSFPE